VLKDLKVRVRVPKGLQEQQVAKVPKVHRVQTSVLKELLVQQVLKETWDLQVQHKVHKVQEDLKVRKAQDLVLVVHKEHKEI
jgi:hypothetical protein